MEGSARYVEYSLYDEFITKQPDRKMIKSDTLYHSYSYFQTFDFEESQWLYKTGRTYFYGIGFNILRLLDKLDIEYKSRLLKTVNYLQKKYYGKIRWSTMHLPTGGDVMSSLFVATCGIGRHFFIGNNLRKKERIYVLLRILL